MILSRIEAPAQREECASQQRKLALWWGSVKSRGDLICASQRSCCVVVLFAMGASVIPARAIDCFWTGATTNEWTITAS
jgi:hypothetical protein